MRDVVITGAGAISLAGETPSAISAALDVGTSLACDITAFEPQEGEPTRACEVSEFDLSAYAPSIKSYIDRTSALALAAANIALENAVLQDESARPGEVGLAYGTQWGCLDSMELFYAKLKGGKPRFAPPLPFSHSYANSPASVLAIECKLRAHHIVLSSGRNSGALALQSGFDAIALGRADRIAVAASDSLSRPAFLAYCASDALLSDGDGVNESTDEKRFVLGEGGACLVIEETELARSRGAPVLARVHSIGSSTDSDPGRAVEDAVRQSLLLGGTAPRSVLSVVGTGASSLDRETELRGLSAALELDEAEARRMMRPLGAVLGETMGASGVLACLAACGDGTKLPAVVVSLDPTPPRPAAVALLIGPA